MSGLPFLTYQRLDFPGALFLTFLLWRQFNYYALPVILLFWPAAPRQPCEFIWLGLFLLFSFFDLSGVFFLMNFAICLFEFCGGNVANSQWNYNSNEIQVRAEQVRLRRQLFFEGLGRGNVPVILQSLSDIYYNFLKIGIHRLCDYYPIWFWPLLGLAHPLMVFRLGLRKVLEECLFFHDDPANSGHTCC